MMGLGYIGLPTAALIASRGIQVHGVDINPNVVETINKGKIHIVEPDLDGLVHYSVNKGLFKADTKPVAADVFLIAVPTPFKGENHEPDVSYVESAVDAIIPLLEEGNLVILESTSPVGTTDKMAEQIFKQKPELKDKIYLAYCPERVLPGRVIYELENNDRAIGGIDDVSSEKAAEFYARFIKGQLHTTNARTAEMCKLVENSYRDTNIAFANELSMICEKAGVDVWELIAFANKHPRVNILQPGPGVGGHCIAVDPWFIVNDFPQDAKIIRQAREVNLRKTDWVLEQIREKVSDFEKAAGKAPIVACMGLAFKPNIDDLRESPALDITRHLVKEGYQIIASEPHVENVEGIELYNVDEAIDRADIIVFLVAHSKFQPLDAGKSKIVLDFCGLRAK